MALGARKLIEKELGHSVVSPLNAKDYLNTLESEEAKQLGDDSKKDVSE